MVMGEVQGLTLRVQEHLHPIGQLERIYDEVFQCPSLKDKCHDHDQKSIMVLNCSQIILAS